MVSLTVNIPCPAHPTLPPLTPPEHKNSLNCIPLLLTATPDWPFFIHLFDQLSRVLRSDNC